MARYVRMPKDYSRHENKIFLGLSFKNLLILFAFLALSILVIKASFINIFFKIILVLLFIALAPLFVFYKTTDGDDLITYILHLIIYYSSPKYLVYKKQDPNERRKNNG